MVKNQLKIFLLLGLALLYCLTIGIYNRNASTYYIVYSTHSKSEFKSQNSFPDLFFRTEQSESFVGLNRNIPRTTFKNQVNHLWSNSIDPGQLLLCFSTRCRFAPDPPVVNFRKYDLIFPFHYFW
jgi:hypothetical protein